MTAAVVACRVPAPADPTAGNEAIRGPPITRNVTTYRCSSRNTSHVNMPSCQSSRTAKQRGQTIKTQLTELAADPAPANDLDLVTLLPEAAGDLDELPADLHAELFAAFDIQIAWNAPMRQATIHATDTTPQIVTALLARASDDHAPATSTDASAVQGSVQSPILLETRTRGRERGRRP